MAINPSTQYPGQTAAPSAGYPGGSAQNVSVSGDGSGTPLESTWLNDLWGYLQSKLARAGIVASGTPDQVGASQYQDADDQRFGTTGNLKITPFELYLSIQTSVSLDVSAQTAGAGAVVWGDSGSKLYIVDNTTAYQYTVSTPYDLSTAFYSGLTGALTGDTSNGGIVFKDDGTKAYAVGSVGQDVTQYSVTNWNIATISDDAVTLSIAAQDSDPRSLWISPDGTKLFVIGNTNDKVFRYTLSTAWDLSTAAFDVGQEVALGAGIHNGVSLSADGTRLFTLNSNDVSQWILGTAFDLTTAADSGITLSTAPPVNGADGPLSFSENGGRGIIVSGVDDKVYEFFTSRVTLDAG